MLRIAGGVHCFAERTVARRSVCPDFAEKHSPPPPLTSVKGPRRVNTPRIYIKGCKPKMLYNIIPAAT